MPMAQCGLFLGLRPARMGVLADRLQQTVARICSARLMHDQALVDQTDQKPEHGIGFDSRTGAHALCGFQAPSSGKYRQPLQKKPFRVRQERKAPVQARLDLLCRHGPHLRRRQFDRQRNAVQMRTDPDDRDRVLRGQLEGRLCLPRPFHEELDRFVLQQERDPLFLCGLSCGGQGRGVGYGQ